MLIKLSVHIIFTVFIYTFSMLLSAETVSRESLITALQKEALDRRLSEQRKWQDLMHYHTTAIVGGELLSYVDDPRFYFSSEGKTNPENELHETIQALFDDASSGNAHPICRFPARHAWLAKELNISNKTLPKPLCSDYIDWKEQVNATRLSLIFPSAYINSPSSMFGHTFFRFDPRDLEKRTDWLSWALSFGAQLDASDNSIAFAYRGIFGGYPGIFNMSHYFKKIKEYNNLENRDIWEYALDISESDVDEMLSHTWELKEMEFDYYFLDENCAFRLLEFIELVRPEVKLTNQFNMTAIPADTVRAVIEEGLVSTASFKPSATTKLKSRIKALSETEATLARELADDILLLQSQSYLDLSPEKKAQVVQVAYSFLRYRQLKMVRDKQIAKRSHQLLITLNQLPSTEHQVAIPARPETGHKTSMVGSSVGIKADKSYAQFDFRVTYHDLLDNPLGYPKGAHIAMGNTQLRYTESDQVRLHRFDFIDIMSMSEMDQFFDSPSWHVKTGYEHVFAQNQNNLGKNTGAYYVKAGGGASMRLGESTLLYAFADARLEHNSQYKPFLNTALGVSGGALNYLPFGTLKTALETDYFTNDEYRLVASIEQNIHLGINDALRIGVSQEWQRDYDQLEASISYRHFY